MMSQVNREEELRRFFPETMLFIEQYLDPWIALNRRTARLMYLHLLGCVLAILLGIVNIVRLYPYS